MEPTKELKSKSSVSSKTRDRVEGALAKHACGEPLTEHEWTIVQYALGGGCHVCGASGTRVVVRLPGNTD